MTQTVSVVIPAYNSARTLDACLDSVFAQTHPVHEVIVVDDGSTDTTAEIARRRPCTLLGGGANRGVSAARNTGIAAATGDVLFFLDSDEALTPGSVEAALEILRADPAVGCVHGVIAPEPLVDDGPVEWYKTLHAYWWRARGAGVVETAFFAQAAVPREVFDRVGGFDESLRDSEDLEFSDRLAPHYRIVLTERVMAHHDEEHRLGPLLAETYRRALLLVPALRSAKAGGRTNLTANTPASVLAAALLLGSPVLGALLALLGAPGAWPALPAAAGLLAFCAANAGLVRFAARRRGLAFAPFFTAVHLACHTALLAGAAVGAVRGAPAPTTPATPSAAKAGTP
ncbi:glycosyltransferase family 2 protein [Streptomyces omiyaensis]|uniref:Glycosyltransferase family 2 protein n=1 Tax=Streptomyces omiyaensis TaxID=68247 RepID=A0ABW7BVK1_9ACTN|nr:glycosyltransferase family A protein [Streptomyces omiyaensis]